MNCNKIFIELKDQDWKTFKVENIETKLENTLFIKSLFTIDSYFIIITDLNLVWFKYSNIQNIQKDKDEFNEHLDSPIEKILDILRDSFKEESKKDTVYKLSKTHFKLSFSILKKISFYSFKWIFKCEPIEDIIDSNSWKVHSDWIRENFIVPMMFLCKNLFDSKELLSKQLDKVLKYVNSNPNSINTSNSSSNLNNISVNSSLSTSLVGDSKRLNNSTINNSKRIGVNIYQAIPVISESIKQEDFKDNHFSFLSDPIFQHYYEYLNNSNNGNNNSNNNNNNNNNDNSIIDDDEYYNNINNLNDQNEYSNNQENIDLNETVEENFLDNNNNSLASSKTRVINKTSSSVQTTTRTELSLFYDICSTPKKNYSNTRNKSKNNSISGNSNTSSIFASLPSSISNINSNSLSSQSSYGLSQNYDHEYSNDNDNNNNNRNNNSNNLKSQFESTENEEIEEKKRKLELEEKLEHSKLKQLNKKKKTKFI